jgi:hypothetical protein
LPQALKDNLYRLTLPDEAVMARMGDYIRRAAAHVQGEDVAEIVSGRVNLAVPVRA